MLTLRIIILALVSFLGGLAGYIATCWIVWKQTISGGDLSFVILTSGAAFLLINCPLYSLIIKKIDRSSTHFKGLLYPLGCTAVFFLPAAGIAGYWGGSLKSVISPEAQLFYSFFIVSGLIFGFGYWALQHKRPIPPGKET